MRCLSWAHRAGSSFWTSYEGWKLQATSLIMSRTKKFLNFLWGMETRGRHAGSQQICRVFELPMRDGNRQSAYKLTAFCCVFELPMRDGNLQAGRGRLAKHSFLNFLWGMETVQWMPANTKQERVFELPMRDGNRRTWKFPEFKAWFLNFLWGMETRICPMHISANRQFLNFLWGMETRREICQRWRNHGFLNFLWGMETISQAAIQASW